LNLGLDILDGIAGLNFESDGFASEGLDKNLHATPKAQNQMKGGLFLDVVVRKGSAIFKLLACKDQSLLIWGNALLVLNLGLDILDGIAGLNFESDGFASEGLDKNLHATPKAQNQMKS